METWIQNYTAVGGSLYLTAAVALLPIIFFFVALTVLKLKGYQAGLYTLLIALGVAVLGFGMPAGMAVSSALYGFAYGLWPIAWIIVTAVFLYKNYRENRAVRHHPRFRDFDYRRPTPANVAGRLLLRRLPRRRGRLRRAGGDYRLVVGGLRFQSALRRRFVFDCQYRARGFRCMGIPILVAGQVSNLDPYHIGQVAGRQLPILSIIVPFWLVAMMDGMRGIRQTWPAVLVAGVSFATTQFITANFIGPELPDVTSALVSLVCLSAFLKKWQPKEIFTFNGMKKPAERKAGEYTAGQIIKAWSPFAILTVFVSVWTIKGVKEALGVATIKIRLADAAQLGTKSRAHRQRTDTIRRRVQNRPPRRSRYGNPVCFHRFRRLAEMKPSEAVSTFFETLKELRLSILSIGLVLGFAFVANYSGLSSTLALVLAATGTVFPFFSPFLGWLGVFLTGSDTSANALFGSLQASTAHQIGVVPELTVAANTTGGVTGKMISPQSIAIACAAVGLEGKESNLFRFTVKHSLIFCTFVGLLTLLQAYVLPWTLIFFNK